MNDTKGRQLKSEQSWMTQAEVTTGELLSIQDTQGPEWTQSIKCRNCARFLFLLIVSTLESGQVHHSHV